jgi:UDP-GlcNAc:undecaprenyl-phosphate GlcNAc-1-phosphate transferase
MTPEIMIILIIILNIFIYLFHEKLIKILNVYDLPNIKRKKHNKKTSLLGGLIILINCYFIFFIDKFFFNNLFTNFNINSFIIGCSLIFLLGLYDDKYDVNANLKFVLQILIISLIILIDDNLIVNTLNISSNNSTLGLGKASFIFSVICIVIFINALNMYDGINLQVGIYSVGIFFALIFYSIEHLFLISLIISLLVFLYLNHKSKVFLGDNGSNLLGFIISFLIIYTANNYESSNLSIENIFILMMLPGLELIRLFVLRLKKRKHPFSADRNHIHHLIIDREGYLKSILITKFYFISPIILMIIFEDFLQFIITGYVILYIYIIKKYEK